MNKTEDILSSIVEILKHIDNVQQDVLGLSERSMLAFNTFLVDNNLVPDAKASAGLQFHDIIEQQMKAINEAVIMIEKNIGVYLHAVKEDRHMLGKSMDKLSVRLGKALQTAKEKQNAFSGNAIDSHHGDELTFF